MKLGSSDISKIYLGNTEVTKAYLGSTLVHGSDSPQPTVKDRLMQLGCVMWFPLDETNGLNDVIGNKTISILRSNSVVWASDYSLYFVALYSANSAVAEIGVSFSSNDFENGSWSTVIQARRYPNSSYRGTANVFMTNHGTKVQNNLIMMCLNGSGTAWTPNWTDDDIHTSAFVCTDSSRKIYHNATLIADDSINYQHPWGCSKINIAAYQSNSANKRVFIKNAMLFNRALTAAEVSEIQTLIN